MAVAAGAAKKAMPVALPQSTLALASAMCPPCGMIAVDVADLRSQAGLPGWAYQLQAESEVFAALTEVLARGGQLRRRGQRSRPWT